MWVTRIFLNKKKYIAKPGPFPQHPRRPTHDNHINSINLLCISLHNRSERQIGQFSKIYIFIVGISVSVWGGGGGGGWDGDAGSEYIGSYPPPLSMYFFSLALWTKSQIPASTKDCWWNDWSNRTVGMAEGLDGVWWLVNNGPFL